ncbi:MAG: hypothetical protein L7U70_02765 [Flavobacteriales bacterium]|nr:hypothetical protein [Flavobacteriales bacterium]
MWVNFDKLPSTSRVWVFQSNQKLTKEIQASIDRELKAFIEKWSTHGSQMHASHVLMHNCFVIIAADEGKQMASGCSIDSFTGLFKAFGSQYGISFFDRFSIAYKQDEEVQVCSLDDFKSKIGLGEIKASTLVYNNLIASKSDLLNAWELPLEQSWQKRYL